MKHIRRFNENKEEIEDLFIEFENRFDIYVTKTKYESYSGTGYPVWYMEPMQVDHVNLGNHPKKPDNEWKIGYTVGILDKVKGSDYQIINKFTQIMNKDRIKAYGYEYTIIRNSSGLYYLLLFKN